MSSLATIDTAQRRTECLIPGANVTNSHDAAINTLMFMNFDVNMEMSVGLRAREFLHETQMIQQTTKYSYYYVVQYGNAMHYNPMTRCTKIPKGKNSQGQIGHLL